MQKEMKRFQIDVTPSQADRYDALVEVCELGTRRELFNASMTLFNWAVSEVRKGRVIASYDEGADEIEKIIHPALENATAGKHTRALLKTVRHVTASSADAKVAERPKSASPSGDRVSTREGEKADGYAGKAQPSPA